MKISLQLFILAILLIACSQENNSVFIYPSPGDLSQVEGLSESPVFDANVNGQDAFVYRTLEIDPPRHSKKGVSYLSFAFEEGTDITLDVKSSDALLNWEILPKFDGNSKQINSKNIQLNTTKVGKYVLIAKLENIGEQYFILSLEQPETNIPSKEDPSVLYLEAGVHKKGRAWDPFQGKIKTLYLEPGAVLEATLKSKYKNDIQIIGRGVLSQAFVPHAREGTNNQERGWSAGWMGNFFQYCNNITFDGFAIMSSPSFQLEVAGCENVNINNLKLCGFGEGNNDGMHLYSKDVKVDDCLIAANDDRICITGLFDDDTTEMLPGVDISERMTDYPVENMHVKNVVFWGLWNGGDIMITWNASSECKDVLIEDCVSIWPTNKAFISAKDGGSAYIHDIVIQNCELYHGNLVDVRVIPAACWGKGGGNIANVTVKNIHLNVDPHNVKKQFIGESEQSTCKDFDFINIRANDSLITDIAQTSIEVNEYVTGIRFLTE